MRTQTILSLSCGLIAVLTVAVVLRATPRAASGEPGSDGPVKHLYVDVHELGPGNVTAAAVADAHLQDLAVQSQFDTRFLKYWVDEKQGRVFCLSEAPDADAVTATHRAAHGLLPASVHEVTEGEEALADGGQRLFLDVHRLGPGEVTAAAVAEVHGADLEVQDRYDVNFLDYWVDEAEGLIWCLAEAPDASSMNRTHEEAHGLVADEIMEVTQGE